jgi:SWI/SNF related-matrix-associated actin-dependent regulator of chromatin subfamily C
LKHVRIDLIIILKKIKIDTDNRPTAMGPPPTSHFHVLADTPSGLQPINPPKTPQPSAAKQLLEFKERTEEEKKAANKLGTEFGLKLDQ